MRSTGITQFGVPQGKETRCLKIDTIIRNKLPRDTLEEDETLSRLQNFLLDAVGPLVAKHDDLVFLNDADHIQQAIQLALAILGNASAQFSQEQRSKALARLNPYLKSLVEDEDISKSPPLLFGPGFKKKAKERCEAITCLRRAANALKKGVGHLKRFLEEPTPSGEATTGAGTTIALTTGIMRK